MSRYHRDSPSGFRPANAEERRLESDMTATGIGFVAWVISLLVEGIFFLIRVTLFRGRKFERVTRRNVKQLQFRAITYMIIAWFVGFYVGQTHPGGTLGPWFMAYLFMCFAPILAVL
ncbi:MAG: hypothetical protein HC933_01405 [Pleurocapsa sp. SU_196_0]|nr:hypothetical protein [Pleurocapsa sp. SU_196_0]